LELVKLVNRYHEKPYIQLKRLSVTSMRNRVHDLATACYLTNRKAEAHMGSLDADQDDGDGSDVLESHNVRMASNGNQAAGFDNVFNLDEFCEGMSDDAKELVKEVLFPGERTGYHLWLTAQRKQMVAPKGFWTLTITPLIMARGLGWTHERMSAAWSEVSAVISSNGDFDGGLVA
jgi:hypothetical protein